MVVMFCCGSAPLRLLYRNNWQLLNREFRMIAKSSAEFCAICKHLISYKSLSTMSRTTPTWTPYVD